MTKFSIVIATQKPSLQYLPIDQCLDNMKLRPEYQVKTTIYWSNKRGLSEVYNEHLEKNTDADFVLLLHDDLWLNDVLTFDKLAQSRFDLIGICGGNTFDPNTPRAVQTGICGWWTTTTKGSGFIVQRPKTDHYFASTFGVCPAPTATLDGCFLCLTRNAIQKGLRFDPQFKWHFYDLDLCMQARKLGLSVGVAPILTTHQSLGNPHDPEFARSQKVFFNKWQI